MGKFEEFRRQYPVFIYDDFEIRENEQEIRIVYRFSIEGLSDFAPSWTFLKNGREKLPASHPMFRRLAFQLGLVELISYWKICCPKNVVIRCGLLGGGEQRWWKKQYFAGLGEFFYRNGIQTDPDSFMQIHSLGRALDYRKPGYELSGALIPIGGGKDSAATLSLLQKGREENLCYLLNPRGSMTDTVLAAGYPKSSIISPKRTLDQNMLRLNAQGFLNGHTPFSALIAFSALLTAVLYGKKDIVLSNESSANESTVQGSFVNHQYSKSFQFEKDFVEYEQRYLRTGARYFSLLRPWSEIQIAAYFASQRQFLPIFKSCNLGSKTDSWCCSCPKCLFTFLILSPFLSPGAAEKIFGEDLSDKQSMIPVLDQLVGMTEEKPFECVGSREEVNFAMVMAIRQRESRGEPLTKLYEYYKTLPLYQKYKEKSLPYKGAYEEENLLPPEYEAIMREATAREEGKW